MTTARRVSAVPFVAALLTAGGVVAFLLLGWGSCHARWENASTYARRSCEMLRSTDDLQGAGATLVFVFIGVLFGFLGYLISSRYPRNPVGWMFQGIGLTFTLQTLTAQYALHGLVEARGSLPGALGVGVLGQVIGGPVFFTPFIFVLLLFPTGHLPSRRWRPAAGLGLLFSLALLVTTARSPGPLLAAPLEDNPLAWGFSPDVLSRVDAVLGIGMLAITVAAAASLVLRFRRSRGEQRQQLKWLASATALLGLTIALAPLLWSSLVPSWIWMAAFGLSVLTLPIATATAILKYRLYEIDVIINRTLVYGAVTATLAAVYFLSTVTLQQVLPLSRNSDLAVAASTLAVAALFRPLRVRFQRFVDRRFYRSKYNAATTLRAFAARLRDRVELDAVRREVVHIATTTMHPAHASLWLRPPVKDERT